MRKCISDPTSPTGWSLELVNERIKPEFNGGLNEWAWEEFEKDAKAYLRHEAKCKKDRIPCSGFKEGEEVEEWDMVMPDSTPVIAMTPIGLVDTRERIAVPIKVREGEGSKMVRENVSLTERGLRLLENKEAAAKLAWDIATGKHFEKNVASSSTPDEAPVASHVSTAEQKAAELVERFISANYNPVQSIRRSHAKQAALICVNEILAVLNGFAYTPSQEYAYWQSVKEAIERM